MSSTYRQLVNLAQYLFAQFVWLFLARSPQGGAYADLKRLRAREWVVLLIPFGVYALAGLWLYLFFPPHLLPVAGAVYGAGLLLAGSLMMSTVVANQVIKLQHRSQ